MQLFSYLEAKSSVHVRQFRTLYFFFTTYEITLLILTNTRIYRKQLGYYCIKDVDYKMYM